jgi:hypothetical protein
MLLKKINVTPFKELFWKIKPQQQKEIFMMHTKIPRVNESGQIQQQKEMLSMHTKILRVKMLGHVVSCSPIDSYEDNQHVRRKKEIHSI